jgi:hypothetical protein
MLDKKDAQWWVLEVQQHPESAPDLIRMLADRLAFLDKQNEELRAELVTLRRQARISTSDDDIAALQRRVRELETILAASGVSRQVILYAPDRVVGKVALNALDSFAPRAALPRTALISVAPAANLLVIADDSRAFALSLNALPNGAFGNPRNVAAIVDRAAFEHARFLTLATQSGYVYSVLAGSIGAAAAKSDKLIRALIPGDPVTMAAPSTNGDLFVISARGRWGCFPERTIAGSGSLAIELPTGDTLAGILPLRGSDGLAILTEDGGVFTRPLSDFPARRAPGVMGGMVVKGKRICGVTDRRAILILTVRGRLLHVDLSHVWAAAGTEVGLRVPGLADGEGIAAFCGL